jgi:hypothetical protein
METHTYTVLLIIPLARPGTSSTSLRQSLVGFDPRQGIETQTYRSLLIDRVARPGTSSTSLQRWLVGFNPGRGIETHTYPVLLINPLARPGTSSTSLRQSLVGFEPRQGIETVYTHRRLCLLRRWPILLLATPVFSLTPLVRIDKLPTCNLEKSGSMRPDSTVKYSPFAWCPWPCPSLWLLTPSFPLPGRSPAPWPSPFPLPAASSPLAPSLSFPPSWVCAESPSPTTIPLLVAEKNEKDQPQTSGGGVGPPEWLEKVEPTLEVAWRTHHRVRSFDFSTGKREGRLSVGLDK